MKQFLFATLLLLTITVNAQVGIGTTSPNSSAQLDISSTNKGLLVPRMTSTERTLISSPATGLLVFQTDNNPGFYYYNGTAWTQFHSGILPIANGGTGSSTQNFVDLTTDQVIAGMKQFSSDLQTNGVIKGGTGTSSISGKLVVGSTSSTPSAVLEATSTTQGFLPPRMKQSEINAISGAVAGLMVWCTNCGTSGELQVYNGTVWTNMIGGATSPVPLRLGDSYGGGTIIYLFAPGDPGYVPGEYHGLIASNADVGYERWGCDGTTTNATGTAIGTGSANTTQILSVNTTSPCGNAPLPAQLCAAYRGGGYTDWYLPSKDELNKIYLNQSYLTGVSQYIYWSSSETSSANAWRQNLTLGNGGQQTFGKTSHSHVRAVRTF